MPGVEALEDANGAANRLRRLLRFVAHDAHVEEQTRQLVRRVEFFEDRPRRVKLLHGRVALSLEVKDFSPRPVVLRQRESIVQLRRVLRAEFRMLRCLFEFLPPQRKRRRRRVRARQTGNRFVLLEDRHRAREICFRFVEVLALVFDRRENVASLRDQVFVACTLGRDERFVRVVERANDVPFLVRQTRQRNVDG